MRVGIIIITYNISTELFMLQIEAIRRFCKDDFEINVIDNSSDLEIAKDIKYHAENLGVNYFKTFSSSVNGSDSHSWAANFAYQMFKDVYPYWFFIDHDCIPVWEYSVVEILKGGHVIAGVGQGTKKKYMWPGAVMLHLEEDRDIVDFSPNAEYKLDTGGNLYKIIEKYGEDACVFFNESYHQNPYFVGSKYNSFATINNGMFLHCINASNWNYIERHQERINTFINIVKEKMAAHVDK